MMMRKVLLRVRSRRRAPVHGTASSVMNFSSSKSSSAGFRSARCGMPMRPPLIASTGVHSGPPPR